MINFKEENINNKRIVTYEQFDELCSLLADQILKSKIPFKTVLALGRGGLILGVSLSHKLNIDFAAVMAQRYSKENKAQGSTQIGNIAFHKNNKLRYPLLICDDLVDEGITLKDVVARIRSKSSYKNIIKTATFFRKSWSAITPDFYIEKEDRWVVFPYESEVIEPTIKASSLGWLAGIIDGDGYFSLLRGSKDQYTPVIGVTNTNMIIINKTKELFKTLEIKAYISHKNDDNKAHKICYTVHSQGLTQCLKLINYIEPYILGKKEQLSTLKGYCTQRIVRLNQSGIKYRGNYPEKVATKLNLLNKRGRQENNLPEKPQDLKMEE
jgi:hypoxanthine phosphoribosyltransferase